ncbi:DNA-directed RNA polymerase protein [Pyrenophora tritici-repentis]|uniref:DNA-directed RNA polymerase subunit n=1 Tax=Pyrenophora tritici-repentis TaxID=45151 RepID=A0A2W1E3U8_9PLEO|nr:DNA-directed RNA polymerase protein [Pyrenophora tritici-repentis]KAF7569885.1 RPB9, DNA-directed RNA polymerase, subunit M-Transcription elongation factor TFIIS [Pyrenophora tritici-repentis]KAG9382392.1 DNA-directed RNA polymerase protein [Pyrenophora tritici-repentis]KAI1509227.1 DNA-directed RNA polymerase protein [Pyrenophora tritici-repentis]KAI1535434.1 RPB9 DNA-directed RNA polymerase subunit M Transcription elongation factor TFIIS [Pyrenophora tritici-repentis]
MALVGTLLFCTDCGNLLEYPSPSATKTIICQICDAPNPNKWPTSVQTTSKPDAFPSALGQKHSEIQTIEEGDIETWAEILQACSKCGNPEMLFTTMQLRGADEGTTIFFKCPKCNFRSKMDN